VTAIASRSSLASNPLVSPSCSVLPTLGEIFRPLEKNSVSTEFHFLNSCLDKRKKHSYQQSCDLIRMFLGLLDPLTRRMDLDPSIIKQK
jgi:hypothetical protein